MRVADDHHYSLLIVNLFPYFDQYYGNFLKMIVIVKIQPSSISYTIYSSIYHQAHDDECNV